jgi:hypothetical protein
MATGDEQANGTNGFASEDDRGTVNCVVSNAPEDDGCRIQKGSRRSRIESVKVRKNREEDTEVAKAVASNHSRPPLKDKTNHCIASPVGNGHDSADDSDSLQSTPGFEGVDDGDDDDYDDDNYDYDCVGSPPLKDGSAANDADVHVWSRADNFKQDRPNYMEARRKCDFSSIESVNHWFPPYINKGKFNCPISLMNAADTRKGKSLVVRYWRKLSTKQQSEKWDGILLAQQQKQKEPSAHKSRQSTEVNTTSSVQPPRKKRRTLADDRDESEDDGAWERVLTSNERAEQRRRKKNEAAREKTQQRKQQQQEQEQQEQQQQPAVRTKY